MSSNTLAYLLPRFLAEWELGRAGAATANGSSTTLVDKTRFSGPFAGNAFQRGASILVTSGANKDNLAFVSDYDPATGTFTVLATNAFTGAFTSGDTFVVVKPDTTYDVTRCVEALNRTLARDCMRRIKVPLTFVPNGDYMAAAVTTGWTGTGNALFAYSDLAAPDSWYQREIQLQGGTTGQKITSTTIKATPNDTWNIAVSMRAGDSSSTASIVIFDESNSAVITPTWTQGASSTTSLAAQDSIGQFTIPATCSQISFRPTVNASTRIGYFGPVIAAPIRAREYACQTWFEFVQDISGFASTNFGRQLWASDYTAAAGPTTPLTSGLDARRWTRVEMGYNVDQYGWGQVLQLYQAPPFPLFLDVLMGYPALTSVAAATSCPEELALAGMAVQFFRYADSAERRGRPGGAAYRGRPIVLPTRFAGDLAAAEALWRSVNMIRNAEPRLVHRKEYSGAASY